MNAYELAVLRQERENIEGEIDKLQAKLTAVENQIAQGDKEGE